MPSVADAQFADVYDLDAGFFGTSIQIRRQGNPVGEAVTGIVDEVTTTVPQSGTGIDVVVSFRSYEIKATDYIVNGAVSEPRRGDVIIETINSVEHWFEALRLKHCQPSNRSIATRRDGWCGPSEPR